MSDTQNIFDNQSFFDGYRKIRENPESANNLEEKPALFTLAPSLIGKTVLDLGCGYGENCAEFMRMGAKRTLGVDISEKMLAVARREHTGLEFVCADMAHLDFLKDSFDVVFSSLAVHYIRDFNDFARQVYSHLTHGGCFIFSQEHPLTTAPRAGASWSFSEDGNPMFYNLADYAESGRRKITWIVDGVEKYHRTFSDIVNALVNAGFVIKKMLEPAPSAEEIERDEKRRRNLHKPNFLLIRAEKE